MKFNQEFIEKVQGSNNIIDIISQYTQLRPTGSGFMGRCPFPDHQEKTPSFSVSELKQVYHCFGCHKSGNIFTFLRDYQGYSFPQSIEFLADRAGITLPTDSHENSKVDLIAKQKKEILFLNKITQQFFSENLNQLPTHHEVIQYIKKRKISAEIIKLFKIGYASSEWEGLTLYLQKNGISLELAEEAKLVKTRLKDDGKFDIFRDRLIFPIVNSMGEVLAFGGRIINKGEPKYLNSPETIVFQKGKVFYGIEQTARHIRSEDLIVVVEGYMDLISLYQNGIKNVVATMGTSLTTDHCRVIRKLTRNVLVLFDGDRAGVDAAERALSILLQQDLYPKGLILPNKMDPDDFVQTFGVNELRDRIGRSSDLMSLVFKDWILNFNGEATEKIKIANKLIKILEVIPDRNYQQLYIQQLAPVMGVDTKWLIQTLRDHSQKDTTVKSLAPNNLNDLNKTKNIANGSKTFEGGPFKLGPSSETSPETSSEVQEKFGKDESETENEFEKVEFFLKGADSVELLLLSLSIKSYANMKIFESSEIVNFIKHDGVKKVLAESYQVYRQSPEKFDRLTSLLVSRVDDPRLLFFEDPRGNFKNTSVHFKVNGRSKELEEVSLKKNQRESAAFDSENTKEIEEKLFRDTIKRVRENFLKERLKKVSQDLKLGSTPEKLDEMIRIQKAIKEFK